MALTSPLALFALCALPVMVWLLRERARPAPLVVPSLAPWRQIPGAHPKAASRWTRRWSVIVALHLLGAASAVVAMAGPEGESAGPTPRLWVVLVDISGRMNAKRVDGVSRLEQVRQELQHLRAGARTDDRFLVFVARPDRTPAAGAVCFSDTLLQTLPSNRWGFSTIDASIDLAPWVSAARAAVAAESGPARLFVFTDRVPSTVSPHPDESWVLVGDAAPNAGIVDVVVAPVDGSRNDLLVTILNGSGPAREAVLAVRQEETVTLSSRKATLAEGESQSHVFRDIPLKNPTHVALLGPDGGWAKDALSSDDVAVLSSAPGREPVIAVVGEPDRDLDRALRSAGGVTMTRAPSAAVPEDADLIVAVREAVPVRAGIPCVWIAPPGPAGPFRPGSERERPSVTDVRTGMVELTGVDVRAVQWRRVRSFEVDPSAAGSVRVMAATEAGPLLARWDASDGVPRYLCAAETAWRGPDSATDWSRLPSFPVFWAAVVEQSLSYSSVRGRGARLIAARVGQPFVARDSERRWSDSLLRALTDAAEKEGQSFSVRRLGSAYEVVAWNERMISPNGWPPIFVNLLDRDVTSTAAPVVATPSMLWGNESSSGGPFARPGASLALFFAGPALLAFFAAFFFETSRWTVRRASGI